MWWYLPYDDPKTGRHFDFEWQAYITHRAKGIGCPYLSNQEVWKGYNDLATTNPELAKEWHPTKNGNLTPEEVTIGAEKKVWWYLPYDDPVTGKHFNFEWKARLADRLSGLGCPFLSGKALWKGYNDLATTNPELAKEWHPTKNGCLTPADVQPGSERKVWWLLPFDDPETGNHFDFEWQSYVYHRTGGLGCPFISGKAVWKGYNDLATTNPELAKEWHPTKNKGLTAEDVSSGSRKRIWWKCDNGHEWVAPVFSRKYGSICPICGETRGEKEVRTILERNKVTFIPQYPFEGMRHIHGLFCDFAILDNCNHPIGVIEFNGKQHYEPVDFAGKGDKWAEKQFIMNQKRDSIKVEFLKGNKIPLLVIPYWDFEKTDSLVHDFLKTISV